MFLEISAQASGRADLIEENSYLFERSHYEAAETAQRKLANLDRNRKEALKACK